jgi:NhaP-type Na+/H+ or K+/H+ antiporter
MRFIAVFFCSYSPKYTMKERLFMSISWIPKSTVPATLASVVYTDSLAKGAGWEDYQAFGLNIQTTTILSIIICEPIGSFLIDQFAPKLLTIDPSDSAYVGGELDAEKADKKIKSEKVPEATQARVSPGQG